MDIKSRLMNIKPNTEPVELDKETTVIVREMLAGEAASYENSLYKMVGGKVQYNTENTKPKLVMLTMCDEEGKRIFGDADFALVQQLPSSIINQVFDVAAKLNGLDNTTESKN